MDRSPTPLEHLTFNYCKIPESMDTSSVYTYGSYGGLEWMGFTDSPITIGNIGCKSFPPIYPPILDLINDLLPF